MRMYSDRTRRFHSAEILYLGVWKKGTTFSDDICLTEAVDGKLVSFRYKNKTALPL